MMKKLSISMALLVLALVMVVVHGKRIVRSMKEEILLGEGRRLDTTDFYVNRRLDQSVSNNNNLNLRSGSRNTQEAASGDQHRVQSLPGLSEKDGASLVQYAGFVKVDEKRNGNLFYWLFEKPIESEKAPLIIWLNGGPGCSSMDGLFLELGPLRLDGPKLTDIKINPYSWHNAANILFLDQPVGTGMAYTEGRDGYCKNDEDINIHFYTFLVKFLKLHPRYVNRPLYFAGESHAGHYIPNMIAHILKQNDLIKLGQDQDQDQDQDAVKIDVRGAAIGNPWIDPPNQYDVSDFAHGQGLISQGQSNAMKEKHQQCKDGLKGGKLNLKICMDLMDDVVYSASSGASHKMLMYDSRKFVKNTRAFPWGHEAVESYMNRQDVRESLHVSSSTRKFLECADPPYDALSHQDGKSAVPQLVQVLDHPSDVRVLIYSGQFDVICNHMSVEKALAELPWKEQAGWQKSTPGAWLVDRQPAGYLKSHKNLHSLLVLDSGHMVPMDVPKRALDMISKFVNNERISSMPSKIQTSRKNPDNVYCVSGTEGAVAGGSAATRYLSRTLDAATRSKFSKLGVQGNNNGGNGDGNGEGNGEGEEGEGESWVRNKQFVLCLFASFVGMSFVVLRMTGRRKK